MSAPVTSHVDLLHRTRLRRTASALGATLLAGVVATALSVGVGSTPLEASADPGDTFVPIGTSRLLQSEDLEAIQVPLNRQRVSLRVDGDFSSCLGEGNSWTEVLPGSARPITGSWTRSGHAGEQIDERIAQASTVDAAARWERTLVADGIRACRTPTYDFHYGPVQKSRVGSAYATWALSYRGSSTKADGGVVVVREGTNVGYLEVHGTWGPADQTLESVAKVAADRIA